jgi:hypothetical protein
MTIRQRSEHDDLIDRRREPPAIEACALTKSLTRQGILRFLRYLLFKAFPLRTPLPIALAVPTVCLATLLRAFLSWFPLMTDFNVPRDLQYG